MTNYGQVILPEGYRLGDVRRRNPTDRWRVARGQSEGNWVIIEKKQDNTKRSCRWYLGIGTVTVRVLHGVAGVGFIKTTHKILLVILPLHGI